MLETPSLQNLLSMSNNEPNLVLCLRWAYFVSRRRSNPYHTAHPYAGKLKGILVLVEWQLISESTSLHLLPPFPACSNFMICLTIEVSWYVHSLVRFSGVHITFFMLVRHSWEPAVLISSIYKATNLKCITIHAKSWWRLEDFYAAFMPVVWIESSDHFLFL